MTIDEAIRLLRDESNSPRYNFDPDRRASMKLGIEALKRIQLIRETDNSFHSFLLPGETEG